MSEGGYVPRGLRVNLTNRTFEEFSLDSSLVHDYVGGRGIGVKMLYDDLAPGTDPLGEENELIFLAGPLAGTNAQSASRWKVFFKSPLTGGYFKSSGGGHFAPELKAAGFDIIVVTGIADQPVYLWVNDGKYALRDATYLWGLDCNDTHTLIREELRDPAIRIACIGPAGESLVKYAGIFSDRRAAGRGGGGAVMGAKNLKAIAVRGHGKVSVAQPESFAAAVKEQVAAYVHDPGFKSFSRYGTLGLTAGMNALGIFPTRNFRGGVLDNWERLDIAEADKLRVRSTGCYRCMIQCGNLMRVHAGGRANTWSEGPEYETLWGFSGPINCSDLGLTVAADKLCDDLGLDTITTAGTISFAYELYERGILTKHETNGLELVYGDGQPVLELIRMIAYREGLGDVLAEGSRGAARRIGQGSDYYAIQIKGLEFPGYDPRGSKGNALNYMTAALGGDHCSGFCGQELGGPVDRFSVEGKGEVVKWNQDINAIRELGIMCNFAALYMPDLSLYSRMLAAATGIEDCADESHLWHVGERVVNLERMFNVREGFGRKDDAMPERLVKEPLPDGPAAGYVVESDALLDEYYRARGWDIVTGIPTKEKLDSLGLSFAAQEARVDSCSTRS